MGLVRDKPFLWTKDKPISLKQEREEPSAFRGSGQATEEGRPWAAGA